jgi:hypothetical protein
MGSKGRMNEIKFSHNYPKIWGQKEATLILIRVLDAKAVQNNKDLLEYDTRYDLPDYSPDFFDELVYYPLPKTGKLIQLIFIGDKDIPFCTIRRHTPEKEKYYDSKLGYKFAIVIGG